MKAKSMQLRIHIIWSIQIKIFSQMPYFSHRLGLKMVQGKEITLGLVIKIWKITFECLKAIQSKILVKMFWAP